MELLTSGELDAQLTFQKAVGVSGSFGRSCS